MSGKNKIIALFSVLPGIFISFALYATYAIEKRVQFVCRTATGLYPGNTVDVLATLARKDTAGTKEKARIMGPGPAGR
jgi:hypothetical protein